MAITEKYEYEQVRASMERIKNLQEEMTKIVSEIDEDLDKTITNTASEQKGLSGNIAPIKNSWSKFQEDYNKFSNDLNTIVNKITGKDVSTTATNREFEGTIGEKFTQPEK